MTIATPDSLEFTDIALIGPWIEASPPQQHPDFKSYVSVSSEEIPKLILKTKKQKVTLNFKVASQIYLDGYVLRYNKENTSDIQFEDL